MAGQQTRLMFEAILDDKGGFLPENGVVTRSRLARWKGQRVLVTVSRGTIPKTPPQLGYYFSTVVPAIADHCGYEEDECHIEMKRAWFPKREIEAKFTGETCQEIPSLSEATKEEMSAYLDRVLLEAALMGVPIPSPRDATDAL